MGDNNEEIGKNPKIDSQSEKFEILEKLNSQEQKFDEFAKKLQSIEESVSKIPKFDDDERKTMMKFEKQLESLEKTMLLNVTFTENNSLELTKSKQEGAEIREEIRVETCVQKCDKFRKRQMGGGGGGISEEEELFNVKCSIEIVRRESSHFEIFAFCKPVAPVGDEWSIETIETKLEFRVMGNDDNSVIKTMKFRSEPRRKWIILDFLKWEEIRDNYLIDGNLTVEIEIEILKMTGFEKKKFRKFDESQKDVSDVLLVVQDTKFYVSKTKMSHSTTLSFLMIPIVFRISSSSFSRRHQILEFSRLILRWIVAFLRIHRTFVPVNLVFQEFRIFLTANLSSDSFQFLRCYHPFSRNFLEVTTIYIQQVTLY
ncbi:Protein CBG24114 [Caenorhabditis briggsae]|uniref:Protein CBG24114 n=1 Tax=Caenorhabditis briggsae TaxID=6238 RepID=A8WK08_CAEBR|nr:Protein CBG24114 [Caenorhabditis briggsae]CAP20801.1 Protein CBG24114 [Caenorhabditis briggsae]